MLKNSVFVICLLFAFETFACNKTVNSKEVVLFIDTNQSEKEIATAKKAACERGQRLISIPQDIVQFDPSYNSSYINKSQLEKVLSEIENQGAKPVSVIISGHDGGGRFSGLKGDISREDILHLLDSKFPAFKDSIQSLYLLGCYTGVKSEMFAWLAKLPNLKMIGGYEGAAPLSDKLAGHTYLEDLMLKEKQLSEEAEQRQIQQILQANIRNMEMLNSAVYVKSAQCYDDGHNKSYYYRPIPKIQGDPKFEEFDKNDCVRKMVLAEKYINDFRAYYEGTINIPREVSAGNPIREIYNFFRNADHCFENAHNLPSSEQVLATLFYHNYKKSIVQYLQPDYLALKQELDLLTPESWNASIQQQIDAIKKSREDDKKRYEDFIADPTGVKERIEAQFKQLNDELVITSNPALQAAFSTPNPDETQRALIAEFQKKSEELYRLGTYLGEMGDESNYQRNLTTRNIFMTQSIKELEQNLTLVTQEAVDQIKKGIWLPTVEEVEVMERKEINDKIHGYYSAASSISHTLPLSLQDKIAKVSNSSNTYLNNLQCLPLSWHEYTPNNIDRPTCNPVMYGGYGMGGTMNDSPTGGGRESGDNSESFEEDDRGE